MEHVVRGGFMATFGGRLFRAPLAVGAPGGAGAGWQVTLGSYEGRVLEWR